MPASAITKALGGMVDSVTVGYISAMFIAYETEGTISLIATFLAGAGGAISVLNTAVKYREEREKFKREVLTTKTARLEYERKRLETKIKMQEYICDHLSKPRG